MEKLYFKLPQFIYAAQTDSGLILLDAKKDKYISIAGLPAVHLKNALENPIILQNGLYTCNLNEGDQESFDESVRYFLNENFLTQSKRASDKKIQKAIEPGGLSDYRWDTKEKLVTALEANKLLTLKFLFLVLQVDFILRRKGIAGILEKINFYKNKKSVYIDPTPEQIAMLSNALDRACSFYPKKLFCLAWSASFVLMALKMGYKCNLVIGVQSPPFYAHAWAQVGDSVINDDPMIKSRLAIILTYPFV